MSFVDVQGPYHLRPIQQGPPMQNATFRPVSQQTPTSYAIYIRNPPPAYGLRPRSSQAQYARLADLGAALGRVSESAVPRSTAGSAQISLPANIASGFRQFAHASQQPLLRPGQQNAYLAPSLPAYLLPPQQLHAQQSQQGPLQHQQMPQAAQVPQQHARGPSSGGHNPAAVGKPSSSSSFQEGAQASKPAPGVRHQLLEPSSSGPVARPEVHSQSFRATSPGLGEAGKMQQDLLPASKQPWQSIPLAKPSASLMAAEGVTVSGPSLREEKPNQMPSPQASAQPQHHESNGSRDISEDTPHSLRPTKGRNEQAAAPAEEGQSHEDRQKESHDPSIDSLKASNGWLPASKSQPVDDGQRPTASGYPILIQ